MYTSYRSYNTGPPAVMDLIRLGDHNRLERTQITKSFVESQRPLTLAVSMYLKNFTTRSDNIWRQTLITLIRKVKASGASVFPHEKNALHELARKARTQEQYDAVASIFREYVGQHFKMAHSRQYINSEHNDERLHGRLSRASSFLLSRGINASQNRPKTHQRAPLPPSTIRANIGNTNGPQPMRQNRPQATSINVNHLTSRVGNIKLEEIIARAVKAALTEAQRTGQTRKRRVTVRRNT